MPRANALRDRGDTAGSLALRVVLAFSLTGAAGATLEPPSDEATIEQASAAQARADYATARTAYESAIRSIETQHGALTPRLLPALIGLADVYLSERRPHRAVEPLQRALAVVRRTGGLADVRQRDLLLRLVDVQSDLGEVEAATAHLAALERLSISQHGAETIEHGRSLATVGEWYCRLGEFEDGRERARIARSVLEAAKAPVDAQLEALEASVQCCLHELSEAGIASRPGVFERYRGRFDFEGRRSPQNPLFRMHLLQALRTDGAEALRAAVELARAEEVDPRHRIDILLEAGDWFLIGDRLQTARKFYREAFEVQSRHRFPDVALEMPAQVIYAVPLIELRARGLTTERTEQAFVEVEFTVHDDGRVSHQRVAAHTGTRAQVNGTLASMEGAVYRPRLVDGEPVKAEGVRFRQVFSARSEQ